MHLAGLDVGFVDNAFDATVVIDVAVVVDHRQHRFLRPMLVIQVECSAGGFDSHQGIDDDQASLALDDGHVGDIDPADLIEALGDLVQPVCHRFPGLFPQARVDRCRPVGGLQELIPLEAVDHLAIGAKCLCLRDAGDKTAMDIGFALAIGWRQRPADGGVGCDGSRLGRLRLDLCQGAVAHGARQQYGEKYGNGLFHWLYVLSLVCLLGAREQGCAPKAKARVPNQ
ncbi:hypothetical protein D3C80_1286280 [compost metagenome]